MNQKIKSKTSFEIGIVQEDLEQIFSSLASLVEEVTFKIDQDGLTAKAFDPSHVALIDVRIPNSSFEKYEVIQEGKFSLRLDDSIRAIKEFEKRQMVRIRTLPDYVLEIYDKVTSIKLRTIKSQSDEIPLPKLPDDVKVEFDNNQNTITDLLKKLKKIKNFSDYVTFETLENDIHLFKLSGIGDSGEIETIFNDIRTNLKQESKSTYSLEYLIPLVKTIQKLDYCELEYSTAKPCKLHAKINNVAFIDFYLAPRVES